MNVTAGNERQFETTTFLAKFAELLLLTAIGLVSALLIAVLFLWQPASMQFGDGTPTGGAFRLQSADGPVALSDFRGKLVVLYFGYTRCPDICPTSLAYLAQGLNLLTKRQQSGIQTLFISVDPERDTPEILKSYIGSFGDDVIGVTGDLDELQKLTGSLGIFFAKSFLDDENYTMDHSAVVLAINPDAEFEALFGAPHEIENFVHDLPIIMAAQ